MARIVRRLQDLPGQELFQYVDDDGGCRAVGSGDVNAYLREQRRRLHGQGLPHVGRHGAVHAGAGRDPALPFGPRARRNVTRAIGQVAARLGNTPAVAHACYVHPAVLTAYEASVTIGRPAAAAPREGLGAAEAAGLRFLVRRSARPAARARAA